MTPPTATSTALHPETGAPGLRSGTPRRGAELAVRRPAGPRERGESPPEPTLEEAVLGALRSLREVGEADCPVCGGSLESEGSCRACGAGLS